MKSYVTNYKDIHFEPDEHIDIDHIGIILKEEFMDPMGLSMNALAKAIGVPANRIHGIIHGLRGMTADTDLRLCRYFGLSQGFFSRIQSRHELILAERALEGQLEKIVPHPVNENGELALAAVA